ncbi:hypothetical protein [Methylosinus sp. Ce-a6]|uniref:hypothetical protein n=1 Tax=Methylosinus sp. Ce-a6 TaxID=2172005 RepID=UPI0013587119|nr:hypothetical protein [Methylosinus sp. Ce-a6]
MLASKLIPATATLLVCSSVVAKAESAADHSHSPPLYEGRSVGRCLTAECQNRKYDHSGSAGRMGSGADPRRPEGAGNISQ